MSNAFKTFEELKAAYDGLVAQYKSSKKDPGLEGAIREFIPAAAEAGRYISNSDQRWSAQDMLDFWFTHLLSVSYDTAEEVSPRLADFDPDTSAAVDADKTAGVPTTSKQDLEKSRQIIRLGALARQWRLQGKDRGYLLKGQALDEARRYQRDDPDIEALCIASEADVRKTKNQWIRRLAIVSILLSVLAGVAVVQALNAMREEKIAEEERAEALAQKELAERAAKASEEARRSAELLEQQARQDWDALSRQLAELQQQGGLLNAALDLIRREVQEGRLALDQLPEPIVDLIQPRQIVDAFKDPTVKLNGYNVAFLDVPVGLPTLSEANRQAAYANGQTIPYVNYSVVLNQERRLAFFSAVNLDRDALRVMPRSPSSLESPAQFDKRVPTGVQLDPDWFNSMGFDVSPLASRSEILWGSSFPTDQLIAAQIRDQMIDRMPNTVPRLGTLNRGVWSILDGWTLTEHNPGARQVTIFTGPVFSQDDPIVAGLKVPRAFWKVVISKVPDYAQKRPGPSLVVDAFVVWQYERGTDRTVDHSALFNPEDYRIPISELEDLTGLRFADIIRSVDRERPEQSTAGDDLAARVDGLDSPDGSVRRALAQELVDAVRPTGLPWTEQKKVVSALLDMAEDQAMRDLSATGRLNLLFVLSQVPAATWNLADAVDLKTQAEAAVAALQYRSDQKLTQVGPQTKEHLDRLRANIGFGKRPSQQVFLQFAGFTRDRANEINGRLRLTGWNMQGVERKPFSGNEVRYNPGSPADKTAAEMLAADLGAIGINAEARADQVIVPGRLEVWLSQ